MTTAAPQASISEFRATAEQLRNWGRWGTDDQLGTLNFITPDTVKRAASLVRRGAIFPLGINFDAYGPWGPSSHRRNPVHIMTVDGGDREMAEYLHGWGGATEAQMAGAWDNGLLR